MASSYQSPATRLVSFLTIFLATLSTFVAAQAVLDGSKLPSCAFKCQKLTAAQSACVPPTAPQTSQNQYQACFCSSQTISTLYSSPNGICDGTCQASDLQKIQQWYIDLCTDGVVVTPAVTSAGGAKQTSTASTGTAASGSTGTAASSSSSSTSVPATSSAPTGSWFSNHWKWVLLLIILFLAFVFFLTLGFWLKRRKRRRALEKRFSGAGPLNGVASQSSPFASGTLTRSDPPWVGGNHPGTSRPMSMVSGAGGGATMARYGSRTNVNSANGAYGSGEFEVPSPPPQTASRNLPWGGNKRVGQVREEPVDPEAGPDDIVAAGSEDRGRQSHEGGMLKKKMGRKSKSRGSARSKSRG